MRSLGLINRSLKLIDRASLQLTRLSAGSLEADIAAQAARCGVDSYLVFPINRSLLQFDGRRKTPMIKRYHPERHYMRGPGPKCLEKHSGGIDRIGRVTDDRRGDKRSLTGFFLQFLRGRRRLGVAV